MFGTRPATANYEAFSSWLCLADLQYVDGLGEFPGFPGAAAEFLEDLPDLELGVRWQNEPWEGRWRGSIKPGLAQMASAFAAG